MARVFSNLCAVALRFPVIYDDCVRYQSKLEALEHVARSIGSEKGATEVKYK